MIGANLNLPKSRALKVLCIGAHCDDIEIGCSGTLLQLLAANPDTQVTWLVLTGTPERHAETKASAEAIAAGTSIDLSLHGFRDGYLPYLGESVKDVFSETKSRFDPDVIFSHWEGDRHQDHRFVSEMTWSTFRNNLILEYEIPKYDGDLASPNVFVALSEDTVTRKIDNIVSSFASQGGKPWFDPGTFRALLRMRGIESGRDTTYAEAFYCRKLPLDV